MVKKIIFLFTFLFITFSFNLNVNAMPLGYPSVFPRYFDTIGNSQNATLVYWWSTEYYSSPFPLGLTSTTSGYNQIDFNWFNANLCPNSNLHISGSIGGLYTLFYKSPTVAIYNNGQRMTCTFSEPLDSGSRITFNCSGVGGGNLSIYIQESNPDFTDTYTVGITRDIDVRCEASNNDIINNQNVNTNSIINNQNQNTNIITQNQDTNTQNIINNQNQNTQDIINNQNSNTQQEIESQKVCNIIDLSYTEYENKVLLNNGNLQDNSYYNVTSFIKINSSSVEKIDSFSGSANLCFYNENKQLISCQTNTDTPVGSLTLPANSYFVKFSINNSSNKPKYKICTNGNQAISDDLNNLNDTLNSEDTPNTNQDISDMNDMVASDTPISDLITMPLTLFNAYINGINATCSPFNLGNLYGTDIIFPCLNLQQRLGSNLWSKIDALFSIFMCYNIGMLFITAFDGLTSLRDDFEGLYQPRHADTGYQPRHGG